MLNKFLRQKQKQPAPAGEEMGCSHSAASGSKQQKQQKPKLQQQQQEQQQQAGHNEELSLKAALLIQRWFRRFKAQLEARRRASWMIYQSIEYSSEASQMQLHNFFNDLLHMAEENQLQQGEKSGAFAERLRQQQKQLKEEDEELLSLTSFEKISVERSYKGPELQFPLGGGQVQQLIDAFRSGTVLHARYLLQLLHETRCLFQTRSNVCHVSSSISKRVTVIGDLHGSLQDLLLIFYKNGLPDVTNPYVFNGDFVDRGECSVEVAAVLFACTLAWPTAVFINRGNHEDHVMNARYGFVAEVQRKYRQHAKKIVQLFGDLFSWTPLATIIDKNVLVVHGGISDKLDLARIEKLDRHVYLSALRAPVTNSSRDTADWRQVLDLLWSDPKPQKGCKPNSFRGGGSYFGPDVTRQFLQKQGLSLLVRSHECKQEGWEFCHDEQVLTIFSASNYYEQGSNKGAFVRFSAGSEKPQIVQFVASSVAELPPSRQMSAVEDGALRDLRGKVVAHKAELISRFKELDPRSVGYVPLADWCSAMTSCLQLQLPWRKLRPHLAEATKDGGSVLYASTFQKHAVSSPPAKRMAGTLAETVYKNKEQLETIFRIMDKDSSGQINLQEFKESCRLLSRATGRMMPDEEVEEMAKAIDLNNDGIIDFNEFLEAFRIVETQKA